MKAFFHALGTGALAVLLACFALLSVVFMMVLAAFLQALPYVIIVLLSVWAVLKVFL